jgi:polyphenol oxidase
MLKSTQSGFFVSTILSEEKNIIHGFSTIESGDMRLSSKRRDFLRLLELGTRPLIIGGQIHSTNITILNKATGDEIIPKTDAIIWKKLKNVDKAPVLGILTADCVPILMFDNSHQIMASIHAGWKGTSERITEKVILEMLKLDADINQIRVAIGPHIGLCCYSVPFKRTQLLTKDSNKSEKIAAYWGNLWHTDLAYANFEQCIKLKILPENIDAWPICTSCQKQNFFSYRRTGKIQGELISIITLK